MGRAAHWMLVPGPKQGRVGRAAHWVLFWLLCQGVGCWWPHSQQEHLEEAVPFSPLSYNLQEHFWEGFYSSASISQPWVLPPHRGLSLMLPPSSPVVLLCSCAGPAQRARWQMIDGCGKVKWPLRRLHAAGTEKRERKKGKGRGKRKGKRKKGKGEGGKKRRKGKEKGKKKKNKT